ncbi:MFS transporter [Holophaga foetida]|uniref:MFS transporter n=1 Tax=Holophaga foetida TaxID=35839 RepID=UPI00024732CA|nr:MFS transporter [Holophaga foetida]
MAENILDNPALEKAAAGSIHYPAFRWYMMLVMLVATASQTVVMIAPASMVEFIAHSLGIGVGPTTAIMMGIWNLIGPAGTIVAGFYVHRVGITKMLILGSLLLIIPSLLYPVVGNNLPAIVVLRVLQPLGVGPIYAIAVTMAATWFPPKERSMVAGLQGFATSLGVAVGFALAPAAFAATHQNWLAMMACMAVVPAIGFVMSLVIPFGPKAPQAKETHLDAAAMQKDWKMATSEPVFYVGIATMFLLCWCFVSLNDLTPGYFAVSQPMGVGYGPVVAGKLMATVQVAFMIGAAALGPIFEKVFKENARSTMTVGFLFFAIFVVSINFPMVYGNMRVLYPVLALAGFFLAWVIPTGIAFVTLHYPAHLAGKINGLWFGIGLFAGVPAIGLGSTLLAKTGNYHASIYVVTAVAVVGAIVARFMVPPKSFRC